MVRRKHTASRTIKGKGSSFKPLKWHESAAEPPLQIEVPLPLRMYNPNEVPRLQVEEPLQATISTKSSSFESKTTSKPVVERATATSSKEK